MERLGPVVGDMRKEVAGLANVVEVFIFTRLQSNQSRVMVRYAVVLKIKRLHISIAASQPKVEGSKEERFGAEIRLLGMIMGAAIAETFKVAP